ncbi:MAG: hypothetical protein ACLQDV_17880 [Candidatus Binataceae bacterium]
MRTIIPLLLAASALSLAGCFAPLASPAVEGASSIVGTTGSTGEGFITSQSTVEMNNANLHMAHLQADSMEDQLRDNETKRQDEMSARAATVGILRDQANAQHDPTLDDLAIWVAAGGEPEFAMKYMLDHEPQPSKPKWVANSR